MRPIQGEGLGKRRGQQGTGLVLSWRLHFVCRALRTKLESKWNPVATSRGRGLSLWHLLEQQKQLQLGTEGSMFLDVWAARKGPVTRSARVSQFSLRPFSKKI